MSLESPKSEFPEDGRVRIKLLPVSSEDRARLVAYVIGALWGLAFLLFTPSSYIGVVSHVFTIVWSLLALSGMATAVVGILTRRDLKVELPGLYITALGMLLYLVAQVGFIGGPLWRDRVAITVFVAFHLALLAVRIIGLESYRRSLHRTVEEQK